MDRKKLFLVALMHLVLDSYTGFFGVYLVIARLDITKAAVIGTITSLFGNLCQPFMGYAADRVRGKMPLFLGLLISPLALSFIGITQNYFLLFLLVLFGKTGSSVFHPAGANIAGAAGTEKKDASFAIFSTAGTIGFSLSQLLFSAFTARFGTHNSFLMAIPALSLALLFFFFGKAEVHGYDKKLDFGEFKKILVKRFLPLFLLFLIMVFRSSFLIAMSFLLAKNFEEWGFSRYVYSTANTVFTLSGAAGMLAAGAIIRLLKPRRLLFISLVGFLPFFLLFIYFGYSMKVVPTFLFLALSGFIVHSGHASNIVMGHRIAPEMTSTISGILMGFAWGVSSFGPALAALLRDSIPLLPGLSSGVVILALFPLVGGILSLYLTKEVDG